MTLFVPNIPDDAREDDVKDAFEAGGGHVLRVMLSEKNSMLSAFVRFSVAREAEDALDDLKHRGISICGARIELAEMARTNTSATVGHRD